MSPREQIAEVLEQHRPYGLDCKCGVAINSDGWWARHAAAVVVEALGLTEEWAAASDGGVGNAWNSRAKAERSLAIIERNNQRYRASHGRIPDYAQNAHLERRWVSGWSVVGEAK